eukprot:470797-Hanusia_phi.AAC.1
MAAHSLRRTVGPAGPGPAAAEYLEFWHMKHLPLRRSTGHHLAGFHDDSRGMRLLEGWACETNSGLNVLER